MTRPARTAASLAAVLALTGGLAWIWVESSNPGWTPAAGPPPTAQPSTSGPAVTAELVPARGRARPPEATVRGREVWVAPSVRAEPRLRRMARGLPAEIDLAQSYPMLRVGDVTAARMTLAVTDDTASIRQLLVLAESGQVFEVPALAWGNRTVTTAALTGRGTRVRLGVPNGSLVLDLLRLRADHSSRAPATTRGLSPRTPGLRVPFWSGPGKRSPFAPRVARVATGLETGLGAGTSADGAAQAVLVDGARPAALVLGGRRGSYCCAVAGWLAPNEVLVESRWVDRLRLLAWNVATGQLGLVTSIAPVVGDDWYLATSYRQLASGRR